MAVNCSVLPATTLGAGFGVTVIDVSTRFSDYWEWSKGKGGPAWRNRVPQAIGDIFERHGFIWGAKWFHFDTMHFEYRPELVGDQLTDRARHPPCASC